VEQVAKVTQILSRHYGAFVFDVWLPTQTIQETVTVEMVRQLFEVGVLQSIFGTNLQ
jgi:hypothetical protein